MRAVVQRVDSARVRVGGREISAIGKGLLVFLGVERGDREADADMMLEKIVGLRIFEDGEGKMNCSLHDVGGEMLIISQFTLLGDCRKGRRPSFINAEEPDRARRIYEYFLERAGKKGVRTGSGEFQAMMKIESLQDGPVTILLDSRRVF